MLKHGLSYGTDNINANNYKTKTTTILKQMAQKNSLNGNLKNLNARVINSPNEKICPVFWNNESSFSQTLTGRNKFLIPLISNLLNYITKNY